LLGSGQRASAAAVAPPQLNVDRAGGDGQYAAVSLRNGPAFLESLRDGREIWLGGERVQDVTTHPRLRGAALTIADLYAMQHRADLRDRLGVSLDEGGERIGWSHVQPRTRDDLRHRREMMKLWADENGGMLGRTPDFMNAMFAGYAAAHEFFARGGAGFGENILRYQDRLRREDLCLTHTLVHPQRDRATTAPVATEEENAARVVRETDGGAVIRGARMLATLAPFADELAVVPSISRFPPDTEEAKPFAFAFCIPMATAGLRFICRKSLTPPGASAVDYPLSARMDEMDCVAVFDDVFVPWERFFIYRNPRLVAGIAEAGGHTLVQSAIKDLAKAEFLLGLAYSLAESINVLQFPNVQNNLREMITITEMVRAAVLAAESDAVAGPAGTIVPNPRYLTNERFYFLESFPRLLEIVRGLGAGGLMMTPSAADVRGPLAPDVARYYQAATLPADRRIELFALASDAACSGFAGRNVLYERFFAGDPWRLGSLAAMRYPMKDELVERVRIFLRRTHEWDARLGGAGGVEGR
jgi:4-hydroxyphenylacetate 3-monooxygenase oxygenase component